jgi:uncharacterized protein YbaR (Trm112 family)
MAESHQREPGESKTPPELYPDTCGIAPEFLKILVCPLAQAELKLEDGHLVCTRCGPAFKIRDGIPEMIIETAKLPADIKSIEDLPCMKERDGG